MFCKSWASRKHYFCFFLRESEPCFFFFFKLNLPFFILVSKTSVLHFIYINFRHYSLSFREIEAQTNCDHPILPGLTLFFEECSNAPRQEPTEAGATLGVSLFPCLFTVLIFYHLQTTAKDGINTVLVCYRSPTSKMQENHDPSEDGRVFWKKKTKLSKWHHKDKTLDGF